MTGDGFGFAVEQCSTAAAPAGLERRSSLFFRCIFSGRPALNGVDAWGNECVGASTDQGNRLLGPQNACLAEALPQEMGHPPYQPCSFESAAPCPKTTPVFDLSAL